MSPARVERCPALVESGRELRSPALLEACESVCGSVNVNIVSPAAVWLAVVANRAEEVAGPEMNADAVVLALAVNAQEVIQVATIKDDLKSLAAFAHSVCWAAAS